MAEAEALATIQEVTSSDINRARELLHSCNGDVEQAITLHFASCDFDTQESDFMPIDGMMSITSQHAPAIEPSLARWNGPPASGTVPGNIAEPVTRSEGAASSNATLAPDVQPYSPPPGIFGALKRAFSSATQTLAGVASEDYEEWFLSNYGTPHPEFSSENYTDTIQRAQQENKHVILWLHKAAVNTPDNDACCRCFQHEAVRNAVSDSFVLFACDATRFDGAQIAVKLHVSDFPTLVVVKPVRSAFDDPFVLEWPFGVFCKPVGRITPTNFSPDDVMLFLIQLVEESRALQDRQSMATNARLRQNEEARRIREMQDKEYEDGLLRDQLRIGQEEQSRSASASEVPPTFPSTSTYSGYPAPSSTPQSPPETPETPKDNTPEWKSARREMANAFLAMTVESGPTTKISLRFPSGYKSDKVLSPYTTASTLYEWAESIEEQMHLTKEVHERGPIDVPQKISIWMSYPPKEIPNSSASLESLGLCPATALNVRFHKD